MSESRKRGLDRFVNFSDAVVAIAATLLVLPLADSATDIGSKTIGTLLSDDSHKLFAFALSFIVVYRFWVAHHATYQHVIDYTGALLWVNALWLLSIVFLPFPTELIGAAGFQGADTSGLYIGTMVVTTVAGLAADWVIVHNPKLQSEEARGRLSIVPAAVTAITMTTALILAVAIPAINLWSLLLFVPTALIEKFMMRGREMEIAES